MCYSIFYCYFIISCIANLRYVLQCGALEISMQNRETRSTTKAGPQSSMIKHRNYSTVFPIVNRNTVLKSRLVFTALLLLIVMIMVKHLYIKGYVFLERVVCLSMCGSLFFFKEYQNQNCAWQFHPRCACIETVVCGCLAEFLRSVFCILLLTVLSFPLHVSPEPFTPSLYFLSRVKVKAKQHQALDIYQC